MSSRSGIEVTDQALPFGGVVQLIVGKDALHSRPPCSGRDATSGFAALDQLRAEHNGWSEKNPPRLERTARLVKC
jgi:hypothetical protein